MRPQDVPLSSFTNRQLASLSKQIAGEIEKRRNRERRETLRQIKDVAQKAGFSLQELLETKTPGRPAKVKAGQPAKVLYRDPNNPENTWAGRGRKPFWLIEAVEKGRSIDEFRI